MPDAGCRMPPNGKSTCSLSIPFLWSRTISPQITLIDADDITEGPGFYRRYLRHLRAELAGSIEYRGSASEKPKISIRRNIPQ